MILGLEFPPLSHIVDWPVFLFEDTPFGVNKVVLVYIAAVLLTMLIFILGNQRKLVPSGAQNLAEISVEFVEEQHGEDAPECSCPEHPHTHLLHRSSASRPERPSGRICHSLGCRRSDARCRRYSPGCSGSARRRTDLCPSPMRNGKCIRAVHP